ncbi:MAG: YqaJ viral recombinase family protein [Nannocystaceae bacterium]
MPLTEVQKEARMHGLGGSDMATILGLNPYQQAHELCLVKMGAMEAPDLSEKDTVLFGHLLEDPIAELYTARTGKKVRRVNVTKHHKDYPFLMAHADRDVVGERRGLEIKNVGFRMAGLWGDDGGADVAEYYIPQPMHYMLCFDYEAWDVAAMIGGQECRIYHLQRDKEWDDLLIETAHEFWQRVENDDPPAIDYQHATAKELLQKLYANTDGTVITLPDELWHWHQVWQDAAARRLSMEKVIDACRARFLEALGEASAGLLRDGTGYIRKGVKVKEYTVEASGYVSLKHSKKPPTPKLETITE